MSAGLAWLAQLLTQPLVIPFAHGALELRWPLVLLLAPLPLLWRRWPAYATRLDALHVPFFASITAALGAATHSGAVVLRRRWPERLAGVIAWGLLLLAASGPNWVDPPRQKVQPARDLLLALDISQSMEARDFPDAAGQPQERLTGARAAIAEFVARRPGDRLGLLVFANDAHLAVPFTLDHALLTESLAQLSTGMAGPRTMIGDAIGLGLKLYEASRAPAKVMILLTDGADTGSRIPPETAARLARERGITVHTIALGQPGNAVDKVDTAALQAIASLTGGRFALAGRVTELHAIYRQLDALEADKHTRLTHRARHSLFHWPLAAALSVFVLGQLWAALLGRGRVRRRGQAAAAPGGAPEHA